MNKPYLITHKNCMDGTGCALAMRWYERAMGINHCETIYVQHGETEGVLDKLPDNATVMIADFSFPREELIRTHDRLGGKLYVVDHHASAEKDLEGLDFCEFDMNRSGAVMLWNFLMPEQPVPILLQFIQDRDIWNWKLPSSKEVSAALQLKDKSNLASFDAYRDDVSGLIEEGKIILKYENTKVNKLVKMKDELPRMEIGGHNVICINTTTLISEIGHALLEGELFVAMYFEVPGKRVFSLRADNKIDVSEVAKVYGGGGHKNAAGFAVEIPAFKLD